MTALIPDQWKPYERYVQSGMVDGAYASGAFTLISAGPPRLQGLEALAKSALTWPIGMVQNFSLSHNSQFNRIFEIGSERSYFVRGRSTGQISLGRVLYHGPSILRALYASFQDVNVVGSPGVLPIGFPNLGATAAAALHPNKHDVKINPGDGNLFLNLASDMFSNPIGLCIKTMDSNENTIGLVYAEGCYIPNHSFSTDSQGLLVQEQVSIQFERLVPIKTSMLGLVQNVAAAAVGLPSA